MAYAVLGKVTPGCTVRVMQAWGNPTPVVLTVTRVTARIVCTNDGRSWSRHEGTLWGHGKDPRPTYVLPVFYDLYPPADFFLARAMRAVHS